MKFMKQSNEGTDSGLLIFRERTQHRKSGKILLLFSTLVLLVSAIGLAFLVWSNTIGEVVEKKEETSDTKEIDKVANEEMLQEKLDSLYKASGIPEGENGKDLLNYGLDAKVDRPTDLGVLVFTGRDRNVLPQMSIYFLDLETLKTYVPKFLLEHNHLFVFAGFKNVIDPVGLFLNTMSDASSQSPHSQMGVHYYDLVSDTFDYISSADGATEARKFEWSEAAEKLAFTRMKKQMETSVDMVEIEGWEVVIIDPETDQLLSVIDGAVNAQWSPDGTKLVYLRSDGLYVYDLATAKQVKVKGMQNDSLSIITSMIDVSPNGKYLAWTAAQQGFIAMFEITNWNDFTLKELGRITVPNTHILWPQFSPDSSLYAVQAIDAPKAGTTERENPRFEIRPTLGREVVVRYPTDSYDFAEFHTDGWIAEDPSRE